MSELHDTLERVLENAGGDLTPMDLVAQAQSALDDDTTLDEAKNAAAEVLGEETAATDGGTRTSTPDTTPETQPHPPAKTDGGVDEHYTQTRPALEAIATSDGHPTIGLNDYYGWYIKRDHDDLDLHEEGFDKRGRVATLEDDLDTILGRVERGVYAVTTYKEPDSVGDELPCTYDQGDEETVWKGGEKPMPGYGDIWAAPAWGDVDLCDDIKPKRGDLDETTRETIEATLDAYIEEFATLYGSRDAVYALDSVGGAYIFGAPEATVPIAEHFEDRDARARVMEAFIDRSNEWLADAQARVNDRIEGAADVIDPDWVNNKNRQYKAPLSLHKDHDAVVTPIDVHSVEYTLTPMGAVDDDLVEEGVAWGEELTATEHTDAVSTLVDELWPDYAEEYGAWDAALEAWAEDEREREREAERQRREARQRREERREELDGDLEGHPITPFLQDVYDATSDIDTADVVKKYASDGWDTGRSTGSITEFDPSWRRSESGSSCYVDEDANTFGDPGEGGGGYATKAMALGEGIISESDDDLNGGDWWEAVDALRDAGYDIPVWTPEAGSKRNGSGEYEQMPFWAVRKAAVALGVCPPDALVDREGDDGGEYVGFPGPETYNNALEAIEDAGLDHGREYADTGPSWPVYDVHEDADIELHLIPINGKEVRVAVEQNGTRAYSEEQDRGFWNNGTKRGRLAGRVADVLTGVEPDEVRDGVKQALNAASVDAEDDADEWEESMRTDREQNLRDRTVNVVCYPAADEAEWVVTLMPPEGSGVEEPQDITFDQGDFNDSNAGAFRNAHLATFYTKLEIDSAEWFDLVEYWLNIQETKEREPDHEQDAAVEKFTQWVQTMQVWADEEGYDPNSRNGYYWPDYVDGKDAICVPGQQVVEWKKREDFDDVNLSRALKERGVTVASSGRKYIDGNQHSIWPVDAEETSHTLETAHRVADDDDEEKPEGLR